MRSRKLAQKGVSMRSPIDLSLRTIGEGLKEDGEDIVQTPMPWTFLDLLCKLDEKEEALGDKADDPTREHRGSDDASRTKPESGS